MNLINFVVLTGTIVELPKLSAIEKQGGSDHILNFKLETSKASNDRKGQVKSNVFRIVAFNALATLAMAKITRGDTVQVVGELRAREYREAGELQQKYVVEVIATQINFSSTLGSGSIRQSEPKILSHS